MKKTVLKVILWLFVLAMAALIFLFSAQNADQSSGTSAGFAHLIFSMIVPGFNDMTSAEQTEFIDETITLVRKFAHFFIYSALGFWLMFLVRQYRQTSALITTVVVACAYAVTDEFHQLFVLGRACQFKDICIDTAGALLGALIALVFALIWQKLRNRRAKAH